MYKKEIQSKIERASINSNIRLSENLDLNSIKKDFSKFPYYKNAKYEKEKSVYIALKNKVITPTLISYNDKKLILEIQKIKNLKLNYDDFFRAIDTYIKFQNSKFKLKNKFPIFITDNVTFNVLFNYFKSFRNLKINLWMKFLILLLKYIIFNKNYKSFFMHSDFHEFNLLKDNDSKVYLIDFEKSNYSNKFIFKDIISLSYSLSKENSFDSNIIKYYISHNKNILNFFSRSQLNFEINICKALVLISRKRFNEYEYQRLFG